MLRIIRWVAWGAVGVVGFLLLATTGGWLVTDGPLAPPRSATGPGTLAIGGPFSLTDHRGRAVTERDFRGRPMAVFFGFTYCPDVCPTTLTEMTGFIEALGPDLIASNGCSSAWMRSATRRRPWRPIWRRSIAGSSG